jgi:hypothetical protein
MKDCNRYFSWSNFITFLEKKKEKREKYWNKESVDDLSNFCSLFAFVYVLQTF